MADERSYAHHGAPILTKRDYEICLAMSKWIATARAEYAKGRTFGYGPDWIPSEADIMKSRLFWRIRSGKDPLPEPPPTVYSCPWYEVVDENDRGHWCYNDLHVYDGTVVIAQCGYQVEEWETPAVPRVIRFNCWRFQIWRGENEMTTFRKGEASKVMLQGWWIQRIAD